MGRMSRIVAQMERKIIHFKNEKDLGGTLIFRCWRTRHIRAEFRLGLTCIPAKGKPELYMLIRQSCRNADQKHQNDKPEHPANIGKLKWNLAVRFAAARAVAALIAGACARVGRWGVDFQGFHGQSICSF